jgi:hypothetical protein
VVQLLIADSLAAAARFDDDSLAWVHIDARHDYASVRADIAAWAPKVVPGGWLSGDDYNDHLWPGVVAAVGARLPDAGAWVPGQWRWIKPSTDTAQEYGNSPSVHDPTSVEGR